MKFSALFTLVTASSALALPFEKRDIPGVSSDCYNALKSQFNDCLTSEKITFSNLESVCSAYKSEKCQNFFNSSISNIDSCSNEVKTVLESVEKTIKSNVSRIINLKCAKDENGNICPISNYVIANGDIPSDPNNPEWKQAVDETCKSKACSEAFINYSDSTVNNDNGVSQAVAGGILNGVGVDTAPTGNVDVIKSTADTIKANSDATGSTDATGTTGTTGTTGATGNTDANGNGATQGNTNQANGSNNNNTANATSDATNLTFKATFALAVVYALSTLLL